MREIELGKELGDSPRENVVQFIGCVTSQSKKAILCILSCLYSISTRIFFFPFWLLVGLGEDRYLHSFKEYFR